MSPRFALKFELGFGMPGVSHSNRALFAPWRQVAETGQPPGKVHYLVIDTDRPFGETSEFTPRLLGAICYTAHGRLSFFPGAKMDVAMSESGPTTAVDHWTLERDRRTWHCTGLGGERIRGFRTRVLGNGAVHWFDLSIQLGAAALEPLHRENTWTFSAPEVDIQRRISEITASYRRSTWERIQSVDLRVNDGPAFWHFKALVARSAVTDFAPTIQLPGPPFANVTAPPDGPIDLAVYELPFEGVDETFVLLAARYSGVLSEHALLTEGAGQ